MSMCCFVVNKNNMSYCSRICHIIRTDAILRHALRLIPIHVRLIHVRHYVVQQVQEVK